MRSRLFGFGLASVAVLVVYQPAVLAFPHRADFGDTVVRSEQPIGNDMAAVLLRADRLLAASAIYRPGARAIYLTDGGWCWKIAAIGSWDAFGLRRPFSNGFAINRNDIDADRVMNGRETGGSRSLSGVIAHETTHIAIARHLEEWRTATLPAWKSEGYADHVAQESSLSDAQAARLKQEGKAHPALVYYDGRTRVANALARSRGNVDALFRD